MKAYPIKTMSLEQAKDMQFKLVDVIHRNFKGTEFLNTGDCGVVWGIGYPIYTRKVEEVLAQFFGAQDAVMVRGAGTGAIRSVLNVAAKPGCKILLHHAPVFPTTGNTIRCMDLKPVLVDFNNLNGTNSGDSICPDVELAIVQYSRQKLDDRYDTGEVIRTLKEWKKDLVILTDDNYMVMKAEKIGVQLGADISAFSMFKLLGPEGVGCVIGRQKIIDEIRKFNYSGGSKVQGNEAMEALRAIVYTPVALAIQSEEVDKIEYRLRQGEIRGIKSAVRANAQSVDVLVEFERPIAKKILELSNELGAAPYPVGAESKYEVTSMFYRVSGTFLEMDPYMEEYVIRINPMRSGADTVIRILKHLVNKVEREGES